MNVWRGWLLRAGRWFSLRVSVRYCAPGEDSVECDHSGHVSSKGAVVGSSFFTANDFRVFEIPDFAGRMRAIREQVRPKLTALGESLAPHIGRLIKGRSFPPWPRHGRAR